MKIGKLTEGQNLMWESSRMMLPEHKAELHRYNKRKDIKALPTLDEQAIEIIFSSIMASYTSKTPITLELYGEYESRTITGVVSKVDHIHQQLKVILEDDFEWIEFTNIIGLVD